MTGRTLPALAFPLASAAVLGALLGLGGCKQRVLVWQAERKAQIGGEFLRVYDDGHGEYGYGVVSEKLKAEGATRLTPDTLFLLDASYKAHFPAGFLPIREGVVIMPTGFHFLVTQARPAP
jgi:hypothetical protein